MNVRGSWLTNLSTGLAAARQTANADLTAGTLAFYYSTDTGDLSIWDSGSSAWKSIGSLTAATKVHLTSTTVAALPAAPTAGDIALVNDATTPAVGTAVTGGSNKLALVAYSGSAWIVV